MLSQTIFTSYYSYFHIDYPPFKTPSHKQILSLSLYNSTCISHGLFYFLEVGHIRLILRTYLSPVPFLTSLLLPIPFTISKYTQYTIISIWFLTESPPIITFSLQLIEPNFRVDPKWSSLFFAEACLGCIPA